MVSITVGSATCQQCLPGQFANAAGLTRCEKCPRAGVVCDKTGVSRIKDFWWHVPTSAFQIKEETAFYPCLGDGRNPNCILNEDKTNVTCNTALGYFGPPKRFCGALFCVGTPCVFHGHVPGFSFLPSVLRFSSGRKSVRRVHERLVPAQGAVRLHAAARLLHPVRLQGGVGRVVRSGLQAANNPH